MKFTATVTIGRNIGEEPMVSTLWHEFQADIHNLILNLISTKDLHTARALSSAGNYDGMMEESATWVFDIYLHDLNDLRPRLVKLARHYSQECIALVIGHTDLVGLQS